MNIWAKMMTALRGGLNEAGEAIVDTQALRILDQEIREAAEDIKQSKGRMLSIIAKEKIIQENCQLIKKDIKINEGYALKALDQNESELALEIAEKIALLENTLQTEQDTAQSYFKSTQNLRSAINQSESNLRRLKQQVDTVKATENVQRAQEAVAHRYNSSGSKLRTAMDSLERIKEKQRLKEAEIDVASELEEESGALLDRKLEESGIKKSEFNISKKRAEEILKKIKEEG